jgi:hypothetical protein
MTAEEIARRQSCQHRGAAWLRARGKKAGAASARKRLRKIARAADQFPDKTRAFIAGYVRGYRAAYKRHYEYWRKRSWWERGRRPRDLHAKGGSDA